MNAGCHADKILKIGGITYTVIVSRLHSFRRYYYDDIGPESLGSRAWPQEGEILRDAVRFLMLSVGPITIL